MECGQCFPSQLFLVLLSINLLGKVVARLNDRLTGNAVSVFLLSCF